MQESDRIIELEKEITELRFRNDKLSRENRQLRMENDEIRLRNEELLKENKQLRKQIEELMVVVRDSQRMIRDLTKRIAELEGNGRDNSDDDSDESPPGSSCSGYLDKVKKKPGKQFGKSKKKKQKRLVHLLRSVKDWKKSKIPEQRSLRYGIDRLCEDALNLSKKRDDMPADAYMGRVKRFRDDFAVFLEFKYKDADCRLIMKRLRKHRDELWTFLTQDVPVPHHNNHAELSLRRSVVNRKVSNGNRSESGAGVQEILMSIIQTAKLQGKNLLDIMLNPHLHPLCAT